MSDAPDRLSPELDAFLSPERQLPDPPAEVQSEVLSRVGATLGWFGGPGPGSGPGGAVAAGAVAKGALAKTIVTLVVGGVIGAGVHEAYDRTTDRRADHAKVAVVAPPAAPLPPPPAPPPAPPPVVEPQPEPAAPSIVHAETPRSHVEHVAKTETRERDRNLAAERALIEQARTALARDQGAAAISALERHSRDFPQGELEEERQSLYVQALVALERFEQAKKVAARFHRTFPRSIFGAVVDEAIKSIP